MNRVRSPVEVLPVADRPAYQARGPLREPSPGWEPRASPFETVHLLEDGRTLEVSSLHGSWTHFAGLAADETDEAVVVLTLLLARNEPPLGGMEMHTAEGYSFRARVRLQRPLDGRRVVDGSLPTAAERRAEGVRTAVSRREEYGLSGDEDFVVQLLDALDQEQPGVTRHWVGFPVTEDEHAQLMQVQQEMEELLDAGHAWVHEHEEVSAGSIHAWQPEVAVFQVTREDAATDLRAVLAATGRTRFEVRVVRYSESELRPLIRRAMDLLTEHGFDVRGAGLDTSGDRVQVHIWSPDDLDAVIYRAEHLLVTEMPEESFSVGP